MNRGEPGPCGSTRLSAVLVPLILRELGQLELLFFLWGLWGAAERALGPSDPPDVRLILSFDTEPIPDLEEVVLESFDFYGLGAIFSACSVIFCSISAEENIYVRPGQGPPRRIPPLGLKSGPNRQFFCTLTRLLGSESTVLLNEVDCFPVRWDWLARLRRLVAGSEPFLILGSPYRGLGRLGPEILQHVNGNALYCVGAPGFAEFLRDWELGLAEEVKRNPDLAYDIFLAYRHSALFDPARQGGAPPELFRSLQEMLCRVRYSHSIHNLAGEEELSGRNGIDLVSYLQEHPEATLVHARLLRRAVLNKALEDVVGHLDRGHPHRWVVSGYLMDAAQRLLDRGNLDLARQIINRLGSGPEAQAVESPLDLLAH